MSLSIGELGELYEEYWFPSKKGEAPRLYGGDVSLQMMKGTFPELFASPPMWNVYSVKV